MPGGRGPLARWRCGGEESDALWYVVAMSALTRVPTWLCAQTPSLLFHAICSYLLTP